MASPSSEQLPDAGDVFWCTSEGGIGQEEIGRHPWIVLSDRLAHKQTTLVFAVPMTSNPIPHRLTDILVTTPDLTFLEGAKIDVSKFGYVKCSKPRHWCVSRVVVVARFSRFFVKKLRNVVFDSVCPQV